MAQITDTKFIGDNAINDLDIRLRNDEPLRGRNVADSGDVNLVRVNSNDKVQLADTDNSIVLPTRSTDPTPTDAGEMWFNSTTGAAKIYDGSVIKTVFQSTEVSDFTFDTVTNADSPVSATVGTDIYFCNSEDGDITINLPSAASSSGKRFKFKKTSADGNVVTIDGIDLWMPQDIYELFSDGSTWQLINKSLNRPEVVAWVNSSAQTVNNSVTGTYVRTGTEVVVTSTAHGHRVGHKVRFDATSGSATDGLFNITAVTANTFTFTHGTSGNTSGNCNLPRLEIYNSKNVHTVIPAANTQSSDNHVNLSVDLPDVNYSVQGTSRNAGVSGNDNGTTSVRFVGETEVSTHRTVNSFKTTGATTSAGSSDHQINMVVFY